MKIRKWIGNITEEKKLFLWNVNTVYPVPKIIGFSLTFYNPLLQKTTTQQSTEVER